MFQHPVKGYGVLEQEASLQTKSVRTLTDDNTGMGKACSNAAERVLASVTGTAATVKFNEQSDLSCAGVRTYNKNVKDKWPEEDFKEYETIEEDGMATEKIKLCEREVKLKNNDAKNPIEVTCREIRKLSKSGHQTSIITTNFILSIVEVGLYMFARWCQSRTCGI